MDKLILYGDKLSPPVRACVFVAEAIGLEYEFKLVQLFKAEHMSPEFIKKNPMHCVPVLEVNGKYICDSHAIVTFMVSKYAKNDSLYPKDLLERALVDSKLHFNTGILYTRLRNITMNIYTVDHPTISDDKIKALYEAYDFMEAFLKEDQYLVGQSITLADICCLCSITSSELFAPISPEKNPKLAAWIERLKNIPYYEKTNGEYNDKFIDLLKNLLIQKNGSLTW